MNPCLIHGRELLEQGRSTTSISEETHVVITLEELEAVDPAARNESGNYSALVGLDTLLGALDEESVFSWSKQTYSST